MGLHTTDSNCFNYTIKACDGACVGEESAADYNARVTEFISKHSFENKNFLIIDRGRSVDERSVVLIEEGKFKGYGFYNLNFQINNLDILERIITPMQDNRDARHLIQSYLRTRKVIKIMELTELEN